MQGFKRWVLAGFLLAGFFTNAVIGPVQAQDASELLLRLNRMENQLRQLSGELEQVQFENKRLQDQLSKFQQDVEFRFQDSAGKNASTAKSGAPQKKSDAYDPSAPAADGGQGRPPSNGPLNLNQAARGTTPPPPSAVPFATAPSMPASTGSIAPAKPQNTYAEGYSLMQQKKYAEAESVLRAFMQAHPKDAKLADATYWLGESYLRRNQYGGAAEQYLKIYQTYPKAAVAPDAFYKLALSLKGLNQKPQACAALAEWGRRYPAGDKNLKTQVEQELKKLAC